MRMVYTILLCCKTFPCQPYFVGVLFYIVLPHDTRIYVNKNNENGFVLPSRRSFCCSFLSCSFAKILTINLGQMQSEVKGEMRKTKN